MKAGRVVASFIFVLVCLGGAYFVAGAYDYVPNSWSQVGQASGAPQRLEAPSLSVQSPDAPAQLPANIRADGERIGAVMMSELTEEMIGKNFGVSVADLHTGEVLWSHRQTQKLTPASTIKLLTGIAVFDRLDTNARLQTSVVQDPDDPTTLVLVAGGDMMLRADSVADLDFEGLPQASLTDLAEQVVAAVQAQGELDADQEVELYLDASYWTGPSLNPSWDLSDVEQGWVAPIVPIAVNQGIAASGSLRRHTHVTRFAAEAFVAELQAAGLSQVSYAGDKPPAGVGGFSRLGTVSSATIGEITKLALETSDNTLTEVLSFLVAAELGYPATFDGARQAVHRVAVELGLDGEQIVMADASGLGEGSTLTPLILTQAVHLMYSEEAPQLRPLTRMLPVSALTGSLDDRYVNTPAGGLVRAKTGSLIGVTSLAGTVLTAEDQGYIFAIIANDTPGPGQWSSRMAIDLAIEELVQCDCSVQ